MPEADGGYLLFSPIENRMGVKAVFGGDQKEAPAVVLSDELPMLWVLQPVRCLRASFC